MHNLSKSYIEQTSCVGDKFIIFFFYFIYNEVAMLHNKDALVI